MPDAMQTSGGKIRPRKAEIIPKIPGKLGLEIRVKWM